MFGKIQLYPFAKTEKTKGPENKNNPVLRELELEMRFPNEEDKKKQLKKPLIVLMFGKIALIIDV